MSRYALLFPGQGSQYVGMGKGLFSIKSIAPLFIEAEDILGLPLRRLMFEGPIDKLTATPIAQPAILLHSVAALQFLRNEHDITVSCALGHSIGEYSALVASSVFSFADAIKAVHQRGQFMQEAGKGSMVAVLGLPASSIVEALNEFANVDDESYVSCANFNGPMQTVIAGTTLGIAKASAKLKAIGAKRIIELAVSAPFHCALMKSAQMKMAEVLNAMTFADAAFPIISNVSAKEEREGNKLRELLIEQITSPVKFTDCLLYINSHNLQGEKYIELGPKDVLSGIVKRLEKDTSVSNIDDPSGI